MSLVETALTTFIDRRLSLPSSSPEPVSEDASLAKGLIAGLLAGLAGAAAQAVVAKIYPGTPQNGPDHPHWALGAATGAAYGGLSEFFPLATSRDGVNFGLTVLALTHQTTPANRTTRTETSQIAGAVAFGLAAEMTRRIVRKAL